MIFFELNTNPGITSLKNIPVLDYPEFLDQTVKLLSNKHNHCLNYFICNSDKLFRFLIFIANDETHKTLIYSHLQPSDVKSLPSITALCFPMHVFEREIYESFGISFEGHPWLKPLRYPFDRFNRQSEIKDYPFYKIDSEELHEVGVGPIHAGVIEPGHFRFLCYGERIHHLEIQLGYQHRGIEKLMTENISQLRRSLLAESIAGDTAVGHSIAFAQLIEEFSDKKVGEQIDFERTISLEMERMAIHVGDTAALCGDVAYQLGQALCEALRTIIINTTQDWCGNRFGKGLVRPCGTNYPLTEEMAEKIKIRLAEVFKRFTEATEIIYSNSGIIGRFENIGQLSQKQALLAGAVGMAARSTGVNRDIRMSHPFIAFNKYPYHPPVLESGDVFARAFLRRMEFEKSYKFINRIFKNFEVNDKSKTKSPDYNPKLKPDQVGISMVEGWRGEICHAMVTGNDGKIVRYKIKDPSLHNWLMLALAVREQEISDFPICNKSFDLSYCGNDL